MKEIYQLLSGAMGREQRIDQIANNLANVNTIGFKKDGAMFVDYLEQQLAVQQAEGATSPSGSTAGAEKVAGSVYPTLGEGYIDFSHGVLRPTEEPLDVAIAGDGFFQVEVAGLEGERFFTRAGNFTISDDRYLTTPAGHRVLDTGGRPILLEINGERPDIDNVGQIRIADIPRAQIGVFGFEDAARLERYGEGLFRAPEGLAETRIEEPTLRQGVVEHSNVNAIEEMIAMIRTQRAYQVDQKVMQTIDEVTGRRIDSARQ